MARYPKKAIDLVHGNSVLSAKKGEHEIRYTLTGKSPNQMTRKMIKKPFNECVKLVKSKALRMGEGTVIWIHGGSENTQDFIVKKGKIVRV